MDYAHFTDKEPEAQRSYITYAKSDSSQGAQLRFTLRLDSRHVLLNTSPRL